MQSPSERHVVTASGHGLVPGQYGPFAAPPEPPVDPPAPAPPVPLPDVLLALDAPVELAPPVPVLEEPLVLLDELLPDVLLPLDPVVPVLPEPLASVPSLPEDPPQA
jgi:hypothetical protein